MSAISDQLTHKKTVQKIADAANAGMSVDMIFIFAMVMKESWHQLSKQLLNFITYPLASVFDFINVATMWAQAHLNRRKTGGMKRRFVTSAAIYSAAAIVTAAATAGALIAHTAFALAGPIIFAVQCTVKTLFNAGAAIYYAGKARASKVARKKEKYKLRSKSYAAASIVGAFYSAGITAVSVLAKVIMAPIIIVGGLIGIGQIIASRIKAKKKDKNLYRRLQEAEPDSMDIETSSAKMTRSLSSANLLSVNSSPTELKQLAAPVRSPSTDSLFAPLKEEEETYRLQDEQVPRPITVRA